MKLKNTTYNEKYPSFDIRAMSPKGEGVPLDSSISIKLVPDVFMWNEKPLSGPLLTKEIPKKAGGSFTVHEMTGKIVSDNVENAVYSERDQATFNITQGVATKILKSYKADELGGKTLKFTLVEETKSLPVKDKDDKIELDENGNWKMADKTFMTFDVSEISDDGSEKKLGGSSDVSSSPAATLELTDVEKAVFKEARTNPDWKEWATLGKEGTDKFALMYNNVADFLSLPPIDNERTNVLYVQYCN